MLLRAIVAMVAASSFLAAASPAGAGALEDCGQRVIRDWYSGGRVDKVYPLRCYRAAIDALAGKIEMELAQHQSPLILCGGARCGHPPSGHR